MSALGWNFDDLNVTAKNDGQYFRGLLIKNGWVGGTIGSTAGVIIASSTAVAIVAGVLNIAGRLVNPANTSLNVTTTGHTAFRVRARIDLTDPNTEGNLNQVEFLIDYPEYAALVQNDINASGTVYDCVLATGIIAGGAITSVTQTLGNIRDKHYAIMKKGSAQTIGTSDTQVTFSEYNSPFCSATGNLAYGPVGKTLALINFSMVFQNSYGASADGWVQAWVEVNGTPIACLKDCKNLINGVAFLNCSALIPISAAQWIKVVAKRDSGIYGSTDIITNSQISVEFY